MDEVRQYRPVAIPELSRAAVSESDGVLRGGRPTLLGSSVERVLSFQSFAKADLVKTLFADGMIQQNYDWISPELRKGKGKGKDDANLVVNEALSLSPASL